MADKDKGFTCTRRAGPAQTLREISAPAAVRVFDFTGKPMKGFVMV